MGSRAYIKVLLLALVCCALATAQRPSPSAPLQARPGAAEGQLTVTLTVVTSVGVVMDPDGQPRLMVANSPDPKDNVSSLKVVQLSDNPRPDRKPGDKKKK